MKEFHEILKDLEVVTNSSDKVSLNEDARQETVQYVTKMREAFDDMEKSSKEKEDIKLVEKNMSYCRFHNTLLDLRDCFYALEELEDRGNSEPLSDEENAAAIGLIKLCKQISDFNQNILRPKTPTDNKNEIEEAREDFDYNFKPLLRLAEDISLDPYALTPDQWATEAREAIDESKKIKGPQTKDLPMIKFD